MGSLDLDLALVEASSSNTPLVQELFTTYVNSDMKALG